MADDKILDRIRKLLALAGNNPNENEAEIAMRRAHKLLAEHNLSMTDIEKTSEDNAYTLDSLKFGQSGPWGRKVVQYIAKLYFCDSYYNNFGGRKDQLNFFGRKTNVETAKMVAQSVLTTLNTLAVTGGKLYGIPYRNSFRNAAAERVKTRCLNMIRETTEGKTALTSAVTALALIDVYKAEQEGCDAFQQTAGLNIRVVATRSKSTDYLGSLAGREAGDKVSLRPQLSARKQEALR